MENAMKNIFISFFALIAFVVFSCKVSAEEISGKRIYYINTSDTNRIYSMKIDGTGIKKISDKVVTRA